MASALLTIASMGLLRHDFHKLFLTIASSKQWRLWLGFVGFMAVGFEEEGKMGWQEREIKALYSIRKVMWLWVIPTWLKERHFSIRKKCLMAFFLLLLLYPKKNNLILLLYIIRLQNNYYLYIFPNVIIPSKTSHYTIFYSQIQFWIK